MTIGETIRRLRRERDITQEELAEMLGISSQAVSGWETSRTAPDLSQLAPLCSIFEVSADILLGIDIDSKQRKIEELYQSAHKTACTGDHARSIRMAADALGQYPDSHKLMQFYAEEIYLYNHMAPEDERDANKKRALAYLDTLRTSPDTKIRNEAIIISCLWFAQLGRTEEAEELAKSMEASWTSGELLGRIYKGTKKAQAHQTEVVGQFVHAMGYQLDELLDCVNDNGTPVYTDEEKLELMEMSVRMFRLLIPDGDFMFYAQYIEVIRSKMAAIHLRRNHASDALFCIREAAEMALHFDTYEAGTPHTSPILRGMAGDERWWHDTHNRSHALLAYLQDKDCAILRGDDEFEAIIETLKQYAK